MPRAPTSVDRKRKVVDFKQRKHALELLENDSLTISTVSSIMDVSRGAVYNWKKQKLEIDEFIERDEKNGQRKKQRKAKFPLIEQELLKWVEVANIWKFPVTGRLLKELALTIAKKNRINNFSASNGWFDNFKSRNSLNCIRLNGEAGSSQVYKSIDKIGKIQEITSQYDPEYIYNMDETALLFKQTPRFTYHFNSKNLVRGTSMKKDHLTVILCTNALGTHKIPLVLIGKTKNPRCFSEKIVPVHYFSSLTGWINYDLYEKWFNEVFLPEIQLRTSNKVLLILNNYSVHKVIECQQVEFVFLPPNVTSTSQPLDQGVIANVKRSYRTKLLRLMAGEDLESFVKMLKSDKKPLGLKNGGLPDVFDACNIIKSSWDETDPETVAKCWAKSNILSVSHTCDITREHTKNTNQSLSAREIESISKTLEDLNLFGIESKANNEIKFAQVSNIIEKWYEIEKSDGMAEIINHQLILNDLGSNREEIFKVDDEDEEKQEPLQEEKNQIQNNLQSEKSIFEKHYNECKSIFHFFGNLDGRNFFMQNECGNYRNFMESLSKVQKCLLKSTEKQENN